MHKPSPHASLNTFTLLVVMLGLLSITACQAQPPRTDAAPMRQEPSGAARFTTLKNQTLGSVTKIATYRGTDMYEETVSLMGKFDALLRKVRSAADTDAMIAEADEVMGEIAAGYRRLASLEEEIQRVVTGEMGSLRGTARDSGQVVEQLEAAIASEQAEITSLEQDIRRESDPIEKQKKEISVQGSRSVIASLEGRKTVWRKFTIAQERLLTTLRMNQKHIGLLAHTLTVNARVYEEAAKTIRLRQEGLKALKSLAGLHDMERLMTDIVASWSEVDEIVGKIANAEFSLDVAKPSL